MTRFPLLKNCNAKILNLLSGNLTDKSGTEVFIMADLKSILEEVKTDPKWSSTKVGVASSCDEPSWARECIQKFNITNDLKLKDVFLPNLTEIYKGSKSGHLKEISGKSGVNLNEMIFFDNEWGKSEFLNISLPTAAKSGSGVRTPKNSYAVFSRVGY